MWTLSKFRIFRTLLNWNTGLLAKQTSWTVLDIQLVHHILQNIKVANINKAFVHIKDFFTPVLLEQNTDVDLIYV